MMFHDVILHKQGPLSRVWIAAHWDRKLSKSQLLQTSIPSSIDVLVGQDEEAAPVTLRISGQLLLGLARIYSRKAKYLQDDCSDALLRIKVAFRGTAVVDLSHEQLHGARAAITLPDVYTPMDLLLPEPTLDQWGVRKSAHARQLARPSDITLPDAPWAMDESLPPLGPPSEALGDVTTTGFDLGLVDESPRLSRPRAPPTKRVRHDTHRDTTQHTLPMGEAPGADDSLASIGVARHAAPTSTAAEHVHALVGDLDLSADLSLDPLPDLSTGAPLDLPPLPAGTPPMTDMRSSPAPSRRDLTLDDVAHTQLTPQTAAKLRTAAEQRAADVPRPTRKRPIQDDVTEMYPARARSLQARAAQIAATLTPTTHHQHCLPSSRVQLALLAAQARGAQPVLTRGLEMTWGAILGHVPAMHAATDARHAMLARSAITPQTEMQSWLQRLHEQAQALRMDDEFPLEVGRRASEAPNWLEPPPMPDVDMAKPMDESFDVSHATDAPLDMAEPAPDLPEMDLTLPDAHAEAAPEDLAEPAEPAPRRSSRHHRSSVDITGRPAPLERMPTPELDTAEVMVDVPPYFPLQAFDSRAPDTAADSDTVHVRTRRAAHVLRTTMTEERVSFQALDAHATRRAAAGFFFELLALGTRDCVQLHQTHAYGDIHIEAKSALYDL
ncbi:sister chromatid cohesion protein 1 [Malassezia equina]|uniref:Sister chromatid cohesion protein 1 n=1 Tax=Malassezia equina TaxID=1381935 RepID=A0AAF0ECN6_9BASI|nr:sister chromatid cohesion protein 1 [Malassezia equina]